MNLDFYDKTQPKTSYLTLSVFVMVNTDSYWPSQKMINIWLLSMSSLHVWSKIQTGGICYQIPGILGKGTYQKWTLLFNIFEVQISKMLRKVEITE